MNEHYVHENYCKIVASSALIRLKQHNKIQSLWDDSCLFYKGAIRRKFEISSTA